MVNLLAYGSLLNPDELRLLGLDSHGAPAPVTVHGYQRVFNQEPSWRIRAALDRAVLNVEPHATASFNAILIPGIAERDLESFDVRERGYQRVQVEPAQVRSFCRPTSTDLESATYLYCGSREKRNNALLPNTAYLQICLDGASRWGDEFYRAFMSTTYVRERTISQYLSSYPRRA